MNEKDFFEEMVLKPRGISLDSFLNLPHPVRLELLSIPRIFRESPRTKQLAAYLATPDATPDNVLYGLNRSDTQQKWAKEFGHSLLVPLKYTYMHGRLFEVRTSLLERLLLTDIDDDLPCKSLRVPYPATYFHLENFRTDFPVPNEETGDHPWEGAYILEFPNTAFVLTEEDGTLSERVGRVMEILFIGRTKDGNPGNDATWTVPVFLDDNSSLKRELALLVKARMARARLHSEAPHNPREVELMNRLVLQIARVLLYLNCAQARTTPVLEKTELTQRLQRVGPGKKGKLERQLTRAYDHILVGPESFSTPLPSDHEGHSLKAHLRRGHFRNQRHGPQLAQTRLIWIEATMVNAEEAPAGDKRYIVH